MSLRSFGRLAIFVAGVALVHPHIAHAELGGSVASVRADRAHMARQLDDVAMGTYVRHDLTRPNSGMIREFTNAKGQVFAVTWSGPGKPDLRSLLGGYFNTFQAATGPARRGGRALRRPAQVSQPDLQIQTSGHMGWFRGVAFIPSLAPAGFATQALAQEP